MSNKDTLWWNMKDLRARSKRLPSDPNIAAAAKAEQYYLAEANRLANTIKQLPDKQLLSEITDRVRLDPSMESISYYKKIISQYQKAKDNEVR
jgi:hypothetical protein